MALMPNPGDKKVRTMQMFRTLRVVMTAVALMLIGAWTIMVSIFANSFWAGIAFCTMTVLFLVDSFHNIDARVPDKAIPMIGGVFVNHLIGPGWIFVPFKGLLLDYQLMYGGEFEQVFEVQEVIPGDKSVIVIPNDIYVSIDPENPAQVIEVGGLEAAVTRLKNLITQRERIWITSESEGPQTLDQARRMSDEVIFAILEALLKDDIGRISSEIPTEVLYGIYKGRFLSPKEREWKEKKFDTLTKDEQENLLELTKEHIEFIRQARDQRKPIALHYLGLLVRRFGTDNIEPAGSTLENVAAVNKARFLVEQRNIAAQGLADASKKLSEVPGIQGDPTRLLLIAEGIVKEDVKVTRFETSPQILTALETALGPIASAVAGKIRGKE
jgi:hypothetical protein